MSLYLNKDNNSFFESLNSKIFVDKSNLIKITNTNLKSNDKFMCVTRYVDLVNLWPYQCLMLIILRDVIQKSYLMA
jgi:hypothetical protein